MLFVVHVVHAVRRIAMKSMFVTGIVAAALAFVGCGHDGPDYCNHHQDATLSTVQSGTYTFDVTANNQSLMRLSVTGGAGTRLEIPRPDAALPQPATQACLTLTDSGFGSQFPVVITFGAWPADNQSYTEATFDRIGATQCVRFSHSKLSEVHVSCYKYGGLPYYNLEYK